MEQNVAAKAFSRQFGQDAVAVRRLTLLLVNAGNVVMMSYEAFVVEGISGGILVKLTAVKTHLRAGTDEFLSEQFLGARYQPGKQRLYVIARPPTVPYHAASHLYEMC